MTPITSPTLLLDKDKCLANISRMVEKAKRHALRLKPHFKTHQSSDIAEWFRDCGVNAATVSSAVMAEYFAAHGWSDITIAFPANIREIDRLNRLAGSVDLSLFVISMETAAFLDEHLTTPVNVYIEIDTGSNRTGLAPQDTDRIDALIGRFNSSDNLRFSGFYSHPGHSYSVRSTEELETIHAKVLEVMDYLKTRFKGKSPGSIACCIGDTPSSSMMDHFEGIDELSPGNYVFYDLMQYRIGSCDFSDIAVALAAPVVAKHPARKEVILHCGAVHLSKERIEWEGRDCYGLPVRLSGSAWSDPVEGGYLRTISQEHGVLACSESLFDSLDIGELVGILPVHSCLTADLMRGYRLHSDGTALSHMKSA